MMFPVSRKIKAARIRLRSYMYNPFNGTVVKHAAQ